MQLFKSAKCYHCDFREQVDVLDGVYYNIYTDNVYKNGPLVLMTAPTEHICSKKRTIRDNVIHDIEPVNRIFTKAYICSNTISNF
jgi:hypothetical protein